MSIPFINGVRHAWGNIEIMLLDRQVVGVIALNYSSTQVKEDNYGAGVNVVDRGYGNKEYKGTISLRDYEVQAILDALPKGSDITDIAPFDVIVNYKTKAGVATTTHILKNVEFASNDRDFKQGDAKLEVTCELKISHIIYN